MSSQAKVVKVIGIGRVAVEYNGKRYEPRVLRYKFKKVGKAYKVDYPYVNINGKKIKVQKTW